MSGSHISINQVELYMTYRRKYTQVIAAAKSGISVRSAGCIDNHVHQPKSSKRAWRTRSDPLKPLWDSIILPLLQRNDGLTPVGIYDYLCEHHSEEFDSKKRRLNSKVKCDILM